MPRKSVTTFPPEGTGSKSMRTRERILDAAAHVLSRKGYAGTRLTDVAAQADLQAPAIYYYFSSREDLIEEVMWTGIVHIRKHLDETLSALPPELGPLERITAAVEAHLRFELETSDYTTAAVRNAGQIPESIRTRYIDEASHYGTIWRKLIHDADQAGLLRPDLDPRVALMMVLGALNWATEWWNPHRGTLDILIHTAQSLVWHGLSAPASGEKSPILAPRVHTATEAGQ